tara:strand:- start:270 stop:1190 length:921 start_codon:yes stop_codon:yes gene_type:complete
MEQPLPRPVGSSTACTWVKVEFGADMCLMENDRISQHVMRHGSWIGCKNYINMWQEKRSMSILYGTNTNKLDVIVEIGANIGACTLQLLLQTNATVLAFEPSPLNLYHLTESLVRTSRKHTSLVQRVVVFPIGIGDARQTQTIFVAKGNAGNSVINRKVRDHSSQDMSLSYRVVVSTLDSVLSAHTFMTRSAISIAKIDVQGFECRVLDGMTNIASAGGISAISVELASGWLSPHGCSPQLALAKLYRLGFKLNTSWSTVPHCLKTYYGCDTTAEWSRHLSSNCRWKSGNGKHPEAVAVCSSRTTI